MKLALGVLLVALVVPVTAEAQSSSLAVGARVRVTSPRDDLKNHVATLTQVRDDSIVIAGHTGSRTIGLDNVTAIDISAGRRSHFLQDAGIGLGVGALAGGFIGYFSYEECDEEGFMACFMVPDSRMESAAFGGAVLGGVGLVAGAIIGAFRRTDRWEAASLPARVSIGQSRSGGVGLSFSRAF